MSEDSVFWLTVSVTMATSLLVSVAIGYVRQPWSLLIAVLVLSTPALAAGTGISVAYGGYLGAIFVPSILVAYLIGRFGSARGRSDRQSSRTGV